MGCSPQENAAHAISPRQAAAVPNSAVMKTGVTAILLIDCIAVMPPPVGNRLSAGITKLEKAKKTPAMSPHPSAVISVAV